MKKKLIIILLVLLMIFTCSCGMGKEADSEYINSSYEKNLSYSDVNGSSVLDSNLDSSDISIDRKLVYTANLILQTIKFDESINEIRNIVSSLNGYFQSSKENNGNYFASDNCYSGSYVIRVPKENYQEFINTVRDNYHVVSIFENIDDISESYFETESHIETLKIKIDRLQDLLKSAKTMSDIIELEDALSDAEYELEQYQNTLNKYDNSVDYATINLSITEVHNYEPIDSNFFETLWSNISGGVLNFVSGLENFLYWIGYNLIGLLILAGLIILFVKKKWFKKLKEKKEAKRDAKRNMSTNYAYKEEKKEDK